MEFDPGRGKRKAENCRKDICEGNFVFRALVLLTCKSHEHQIVFRNACITLFVFSIYDHNLKFVFAQ